MQTVNMDNFKNLLVDYFKLNKKLPDVTIKSNSSLCEVLNALLIGNIDNEKAGVSNRNRIKNLVDDFTNIQDEESFFSDSMNLIDDVSNHMADKIIETKTNLDNIHVTIESLTKEITSIKDDMLAKDPYTSKYLNKTEFNEDYNMVPWDSLLSLGRNKVILLSGNDFADTQTSTSTNNHTLTRIKNRLNFNYRDNGEYYDLELPKDTTNELVEIVKNSISDLNMSTIEDCINVLSKSSKGRTFMNKVLRATDNVKKRTDGLIYYLFNVDVYSKIFDCVEQVSSSILSEETLKKLNSNIENLKQYVLFMGYYSLHTKENIFNNTLVLPNKMVNPDTYNKFETDGGTQLQISHFLYIKYPNNLALPYNGIPNDIILNSNKDIEKRVEADELNIGMKVKKKTIISEKKAVVRVLTNYINALAKDEPQLNLNKRNMSSLINGIGDSIALNNDNTDNSIYKFIISNVYRNSFIYSAYKRLGVAYSKQLKTTSEISNEDLTIINNSVFTELVVDFVKDNFLEIK